MIEVERHIEVFADLYALFNDSWLCRRRQTVKPSLLGLSGTEPGQCESLPECLAPSFCSPLSRYEQQETSDLADLFQPAFSLYRLFHHSGSCPSSLVLETHLLREYSVGK